MRIAQAIAALFGKQTENNAAALSAEIEGIGAGFDDANVSAKALQKTLGGFDELNRLQPKAEEAGGGGGVGGISIEPLDWNLDGLDKATDSITTINDSLKEIGSTLEWLKKLLIAGLIVGGLMVMPKLLTQIGNYFSSIGDKIRNVGTNLFNILAPETWSAALKNIKVGFFSIFDAIKDNHIDLAEIIDSGGLAGPMKFAAIAAAIVALIARIRELWQTNEEFRNRVISV